jgi:hypothetical protein
VIKAVPPYPLPRRISRIRRIHTNSNYCDRRADISLYSAIMLCYLLEEIDAAPGDELELINKAIESGVKVVEYLDLPTVSGDKDYG